MFSKNVVFSNKIAFKIVFSTSISQFLTHPRLDIQCSSVTKKCILIYLVHCIEPNMALKPVCGSSMAQKPSTQDPDKAHTWQLWPKLGPTIAQTWSRYKSIKFCKSVGFPRKEFLPVLCHLNFLLDHCVPIRPLLSTLLSWECLGDYSTTAPTPHHLTALHCTGIYSAVFRI